jgi:hypothetical protein
MLQVDLHRVQVESMVGEAGQPVPALTLMVQVEVEVVGRPFVAVQALGLQ